MSGVAHVKQAAVAVTQLDSGIKRWGQVQFDDGAGGPFTSVLLTDTLQARCVDTYSVCWHAGLTQIWIGSVHQDGRLGRANLQA